MINVCLLGATGSIGSQVLDLIKNNDNYRLVAFSFGDNTNKALEIVREFKPLLVSGRTIERVYKIKEDYPSVEITYGDLGLQQIATYNNLRNGEYIVINALVGAIGLLPTIAAINLHRKILLANKETLVIGGEIIMPLAKAKGVEIIPIDSEHSAIFQLLEGHSHEEIKRLIITASGGPFRTRSKETLHNVTIEEALHHPNWQMGKKITIDCATLMNKGFELIEAHYLFDLEMDKIIPVIHPESNIHSLVEFVDGAIFAQMGVSDMHLPIQYALNYPHHINHEILQPFDFTKAFSLNFMPVDEERFSLISVTKEVMKKKGVYPTIMNAANTAAVELFLNHHIYFDEIEQIIIEALNDHTYDSFKTGKLDAMKIITLDEVVKNTIFNKYERRDANVFNN